ncbi:MAG: acyltransferase family protein [Cyanobacteria bacterium P01_D01_bin.71]
MTYRAEIDGLRAIAVISVILFHAGLKAFSGGFIGVDIFFVISGYLITQSILTAMAGETFSLAHFYERRARRILPALFLILLISFWLAWLWLRPSDMQDFAKSLIAAPTFTSNFLFWLEAGYWSTASELKPLLHTWTLAIEAQFYCMFPLFLVLIQRFHQRWRLRALILLTITSLVIAQWGAYTLPTANFFLLPSRFWELGLGALIAIRLLNQKTIRYPLFSFELVNQTLRNELFSLLGLILIGYVILTFDETVPFPSFFTLLPTVGTGLIIAFATNKTRVGKLLGTPVLVRLGLISYSAYLWHYPLFAFARHLSLGVPHQGIFLALALLSLPLAYLSWRYVEQPFRNRRLISRKTVIILGLIGTIGFLQVGIAGQLTAGFSDRLTRRQFVAGPTEKVIPPALATHLQNGSVEHFFTPTSIDQIQLTAFEEPLKPQQKWSENHGFGLSPACDGALTLMPDCRTSEEPEILIWGDSFAMHLIPGILASNPEAKIIQMTKSVCGPFFDMAPVSAPNYPVSWAQECLEFTAKVREWLNKSNTIKYAVLSSPFSQYMLDDETVLLRNGELAPADMDLAVQAFETTLSELQSLGIGPIVFSPPPANEIDLGRCLARAEWMGVNLDRCDFQEASMSDKRRLVYQFLDIIQQNYRVLRLDQLTCHQARCKTHFDNVWLYRDARHFTDEGVAVLGKKYDFYKIITGY